MSTIGHNSGARPTDDIKNRYELNVIAISEWVGKRRREEALHRSQIADLSGLDRALTLRHSGLDIIQDFYRSNPQSDAAPGVAILVTTLSDNSNGACSVSIARIAQFLGRSERAISDCVKRLEEGGQIFVERIPGVGNFMWPVVNPVFAEYRDAITIVLDSYAPRKAGPLKQDSGVALKQPSPPKQPSGDANEPLKQDSGVVNFPVKSKPEITTPEAGFTPEADFTPEGQRSGPLKQPSANTTNIDTAKEKDSSSLRSDGALVKVADALELELVAEGDEFGQAPTKKQSNRKPHDPKKKGPLIAHIEGLRESKALHEVIMRVAYEHGGEAAGWTEQHIADLKKKWANKWLVTKKAQTAAEWVLLFEAFCLENYNQPRRPFGNSRFPTATEIKQQDKDFLASLRKR